MKDTIEMAREAEIEVTFEYKDGDLEWGCSTAQLKTFEALVRADEREACAKVCDDIDASHWGCEVKASWCSREIRARGETK
jgi:hypothetical protein